MIELGATETHQCERSGNFVIPHTGRQILGMTVAERTYGPCVFTVIEDKSYDIKSKEKVYALSLARKFGE